VPPSLEDDGVQLEGELGRMWPVQPDASPLLEDGVQLEEAFREEELGRMWPEQPEMREWPVHPDGWKPEEGQADEKLLILEVVGELDPLGQVDAIGELGQQVLTEGEPGQRQADVIGKGPVPNEQLDA